MLLVWCFSWKYKNVGLENLMTVDGSQTNPEIDVGNGLKTKHNQQKFWIFSLPLSFEHLPGHISSPSWAWQWLYFCYKSHSWILLLSCNHFPGHKTWLCFYTNIYYFCAITLRIDNKLELIKSHSGSICPWWSERNAWVSQQWFI